MIYKLIASVIVDVLFKRPTKRNIAKIDKKFIVNLKNSGEDDLADTFSRADEILSSYTPKEVYVKSFDGTVLFARYFPAPGPQDLTFVLLHGYKGSGGRNFILQFELLRKLGCNILMIDQRAHGKSGGKYITFGVKEQYDVEAWVNWLRSLNPNVSIVLYGVSMGASTALIASSIPSVSQNLSAIIADCGFTSPAEEFVNLAEFKGKKAPKKFLTESVEVVRKKADFLTTAYSTLDSVSRMYVPVLFVHGEKDKFVSPSFTVRNYEACSSPYKRLLMVPDAQHVGSFQHAPEQYTEEIKALLSRIRPS